MNNSIYKFSLDVHETSSQVLIELKQNDTAREFHISLTENGRPYIIGENCYAVFTALKPDGKRIFNGCEDPECTDPACQNSKSKIIDNVIRYNITPQTTVVLGEVLCELKLYGENNEVLTSPTFTILVTPSVFQNGDVLEDSKSEYVALGNLLVKTKALNAELTQKLKNGEFQGEDGKSAYEIAVENGFEGTEQEWLESLKGSDGVSAEIKEGSIDTKHLQSFAVTGEKVAYNTLTGAHFKNKSIFDSAIGGMSGGKIENKSITHEKMVEDYATKDYVNNTVKNVVAAEPLIKSEITIPDNFENYESYQVVEITEKIQKDWKNVKIWSSSDGLVVKSSNPTDFDFSQIPETNYAEISGFPTVLDISSIENENSVDALAFYDESAKKFLIIQYLNGTVGLNLYDGTTNEYYVIQYTPDIGWTNHDELVSDEYLSKFTGVYPTLKFVDIGEVFVNTFPEEEIIPEGAIHTPGLLLNLLLKHIMAVYYPPGYYLTERTEEYATKKDITEINERLDTLVPKAWADVQQLVRSGKASQAFSIGDQLVCSKNGIAHVWDIIGFDVDAPINPNYTHSMTLQLNTAFEGVAFDDSSNDYSSSDIRTHLNGDYLTGFDEDFLSVIGGIRKSELLYNTDAESEEDDIYPESDIFFLLSADEVSSNPYEYYSSAEADATIRIKFLGSNNPTNWRLRSTNLSGNATNITDIVSTGGSITSGSIGRASYSLAPACVIY